MGMMEMTGLLDSGVSVAARHIHLALTSAYLSPTKLLWYFFSEIFI